jgi:hypothetical protein
VLTLGLALATLTAVGVVWRLSGSSLRSAGCGSAARDSISYQATMSRDLGGGTRALLADTNRFVEQVRSRGSETCEQVVELVAESAGVIGSECVPCAERLRRDLTVTG